MSERRDAFKLLARKELATRSLADFCALMDDSYVHAPHIELLCSHLEALEKREIDRLMVSLPPRHSKTYHCSQAFPAFYLGKRPREPVVLASYNAELAESNARRVRDLINDRDRYPLRRQSVRSRTRSAGSTRPKAACCVRSA